MKNSTIIAIVALLVAVAGAAIGLAAFMNKKRKEAALDEAAYEFPFDDEFECDECDECCGCCDEDETPDDTADIADELPEENSESL